MHSLRYVILHHAGIAEPHFDLMFETLPGSMLATWRSAVWPIDTPTVLTRLRDHRRLYLEYEGDLTDQRGTVMRVAEGTCQVHVGENSIWTIRILGGATPHVLILRRLDADQWQVTSETTAGFDVV